eukprot:m.345406 g.345406  ORF g.345406 m.345406 type:complete len:603 (+) comp26279_c0_seq1:186-1994(+)
MFLLAFFLVLPLYGVLAQTNCTMVSGWTFSVGSAHLKHFDNVTSGEGCCTACLTTKGCGGWTVNLGPHGNGCWLHGPPTNATVPKHCNGPCIAGNNGEGPLPPIPPTPPAPPAPPPSPPQPLAVPSRLQLDWYSHDRAAMITWNLYVNCIDKNDPDASDIPCRSCVGSDSTMKRVVKAEAINRHYPYDFNVTKQVEAAASFGASYIIFVVNQLVGFALWNTKLNNFSISHTPFRGGGYDIVTEYIQACQLFNIKPGIFYTANTNIYNGVGNRGLLGPRAFSSDEQDDFIVAQLSELMLGKYGSIFELWFDGGINNNIYPKTTKFMLEHGRNWVTHGFPAMNGIRWCGNEDGVQHQPNWAGVTGDPLSPRYSSLKPSPQGNIYFPSAADAVLREHCWGWVNNSREPTPTRGLVHKYITSTGQGSKLVLNIAPMASGYLNDTDILAYRKLGIALECLFGPEAMVMNTTFDCAMDAVNGTWQQSWDVTDTISNFTTIVIRENVTLGQRIANWELFARNSPTTSWENITSNVTKIPVSIGYKRMFDNQTFIKGSLWTEMKLVVTSVTDTNLPPRLSGVMIYNWTSRENCLEENVLEDLVKSRYSQL